MSRISAMFIAICMVVIAASLGAVLYLGVGVNGLASVMAAVATLLAMALYKIITTKQNGGQIDSGIVELARGVVELRGRLAEIDRRIDILEERAATAETQTHGIDPLVIEIGELGGLVNQLAQTVAAHEAELHDRAKAIAAAADPAMAAPRLENPDVTPPAPEPPPAPANDIEAAGRAVGGAGRFAGLSRERIVDMIGQAVDANRIDLYLQPIVTLPQRKVRYYEALSRLRTEEGDLVPAAEFISFVEGTPAVLKLDNLLLLRSVQVLHRLQLKNRDVGLFCNVDSATLSDPAHFQQFLEFMEANRALAPALMLEFRQKAYRSFGPIEHESLAALAERGFRFSMDHVGDLRMAPKELAECSFRVVKVPAPLLLDHAPAALSDIHPADLADLLARSGIDLVVERIESEATVVDLLDQSVRFGQGFLFSPPRPVRSEALPRANDTDAKAAAAASRQPSIARAAKVAAR